MELNWLKYFYEVARLGSVTRAGEHLKISQPAVTKTVRQLEDRLGYKILVKSGRNIRLTSEGERLYQHCVPLFKKIEQIKSLGSEIATSWTGTIRIGASDNLCNYLLPQVIEGMQRAMPQADWMIYSGSSKEIKQRLVVGEVDIGFFYTELSLGERHLLREEKLGDVPFVGVCSSKFGKTMNLSKARKCGMTYVGVRFADYSNTLPEQWIVKNLALPYDRTIQANSKETQKRMVLAGLGFGIFPQFMIEADLRAKKLTLIEGSKKHMELRTVLRADDTLTAPMNLLIKSLKKLL